MPTTKHTLKPFLRCGTNDDTINSYIMAEEVAAQSDFGELDNNVIVVDTESTGLSITSEDIIQIAAAKIKSGKITD